MGNLDHLPHILGCRLAAPLHRNPGRTAKTGQCQVHSDKVSTKVHPWRTIETVRKESIMAVMIKLRFPEPPRDFASVQALPGLADLDLDPKAGLVPISPSNSQYVVYTDHLDDLERRRQLSPEIIEAYGDVRISTARRIKFPT